MPLLAPPDSEMPASAGQDKRAKSSPAGDSPARTKQKSDKKRELGESNKSDKGLNEILELLTKQTLSNSHKLRDLNSIMIDVFLIPADMPEILSMQEQGSYHSAKAKGNPAHELGPPHVYIAIGMITALARRQPAEIGGQENSTTLTEMSKWMGEVAWEEVNELFRYCKESKVVDSKTRRIEICCTKTEPRMAVLAALRSIGAKQKRGRAPLGAMERELQQWLSKDK